MMLDVAGPHVAQGEVVGPATHEGFVGKGVAVLFSGNKGPTDCLLTDLSRTPPPDALDLAKARVATADVALVEAEAARQKAAKAAHAAPPNRTAVIHHPSGDLKKVSLDFDAPGEAYYSNDAAGGCGVVRGEHRCWRHRDWRVGRYEVGSTEGGSSGAPRMTCSIKARCPKGRAPPSRRADAVLSKRLPAALGHYSAAQRRCSTAAET